MNPTAIIELTENCNLECTFCLRPSFTPPVMSESTLEKIVMHLIKSTEERADFIWHGGEPLLSGLSFFKNIPILQNKYNERRIKIVNNVQTNGTPLTKEYIEFFEMNNFFIGTSLQGTREIHDMSRITNKGGQTYDKIISNIKNLKEKPSSIVVLTTDILGKEEEVYYEAKKHASGMRVSEYFPGGLNPSKKLNNFENREGRPEPLMPSSVEYGSSMIKFYDVWKNDSNPIDLRPITEIIRSFVIGKSEGCLYSQDACHNSVIGIKSNGDFYTCIRGAPDKKFFIGNVDDKPLKKYENTSKKSKELRIMKLMEGPCGSCKFWNYCNGGCPLESWKLYGDMNHRTFYCEGRKMLFEHIYGDLFIK